MAGRKNPWVWAILGGLRDVCAAILLQAAITADEHSQMVLNGALFCSLMIYNAISVYGTVYLPVKNNVVPALVFKHFRYEMRGNILALVIFMATILARKPILSFSIPPILVVIIVQQYVLSKMSDEEKILAENSVSE